MNEYEILDIENKKKTGAKPHQLRYMKNRYHNDENYRNNQIKNAITHYTKIREELIDKYKNDVEYRSLRNENSRIYYQNKKEELKAKREAKKKAIEKQIEEELAIEDFGGHIMNMNIDIL